MDSAWKQKSWLMPSRWAASWNASSGDSQGWQQWRINLNAYAGQQVEVSITYMSDWGTQGLGVFLDNARIEVNGSVAQQTSFEADLGGWTVAGPPPGSGANSSDWARSQLAFDSGAGVTTTDSVFLGFGVEGLPETQRVDLIRRAMKHLRVR